MKSAKPLLIAAAATFLLGWIGSCGVGYVASRPGNGGVVIALRDISIIILAIFSLVGTLIAGGIYFGLAWAMAQFGPKGVTGVSWVKRKALWLEGKVEAGLDRAAVRPIAKTARYLTEGKTLVVATATVSGNDRTGALHRQRDAIVRSVTSLVRQGRRSRPAPGRAHGMTGATPGLGSEV